MEDELRDSIRATMATVSKPPPMSTEQMLATARRARVRRRVGWTCAGSLAIAAVVLGGVALGGGGGPSGGGLSWLVGAAPSTSVDAGGGTDTKEPWPTGPDGKPQEDRTARAGARYEQGVHLLDALLGSLPVGYGAPDTPGDNASPPSRYHQANFEERVDGVEVWSYQAYTALTSAGGTGRLLVEVYTPGNRLAEEPCALAGQFWGMAGECLVVTVGPASVGVVVQPGQDKRFEQWAAYRYPDGVVVFVAQGRSFNDSGAPLASLPFTVQELAQLATDARFRPV